MLWIKAFHIIFVVTWFAGLFYLPRLFIYHLTAHDQTSHERFCVMERKLFAIMTIGAVLAAGFGVGLLAIWPGFLKLAWVQAKLALVAGLIGYHLWCGLLVRAFRDGKNRHSDRWLRWFNEAPALFLVAIVLLAILKPA